MFPEDYNELSEAENKPQRQYVSSIPNPDANKLLRENEKLKKSLEKEQFFNKLLDQELKDLKNANGDYTPYDPNAFVQPRGVSKGAFYTVLVIALGLAGYIAYNYFNNRPVSIIGDDKVISAPAAAATVKDSVPNIIADRNAAEATPKKSLREERAEIKAEEDKVALTDLNKTKVVAPPVVKESPKAVPQTTVAEKNSTTDNKTPENTNNAGNTDATTDDAAGKSPTAAQNEATTQNQPAAATTAAAPAGDNRPVIAYYTVTSKANFYTRPDENTMRSAFIAQYNNTKVGALEESNGFIYVVYTNELGYTIKGWLSLKDLTKVSQ